MHCNCLLVGFLLVTPSAFGQTSPSDSQGLQALLLEVRQLHNDLQTNTATTLRTQILFFRIQTQQTAVTDASRRVDELHSKVVEIQAERKKDEAQSRQIQDALEKTENFPE